jgi:hypothetical protein
VLWILASVLDRVLPDQSGLHPLGKRGEDVMEEMIEAVGNISSVPGSQSSAMEAL